MVALRYILAACLGAFVLGMGSWIFLPAPKPVQPQTLEERWSDLLGDLQPCESLIEPGFRVVDPDLDCRDGNNWSTVGIVYHCVEGGQIIYSAHGDKLPVIGRRGGLWYAAFDVDIKAKQLGCTITP